MGCLGSILLGLILRYRWAQTHSRQLQLPQRLPKTAQLAPSRRSDRGAFRSCTRAQDETLCGSLAISAAWLAIQQESSALARQWKHECIMQIVGWLPCQEIRCQRKELQSHMEFESEQPASKALHSTIQFSDCIRCDTNIYNAAIKECVKMDHGPQAECVEMDHGPWTAGCVPSMCE